MKGVTIKYLTAFEAQPGSPRKAFIATRRKMVDGDDEDDESFWDQRDGKWEYGKFVDGEWTVDKTAGDRPPWLSKDGEKEEDDNYVAGGIKRCGFTWDDAAAKVGAKCMKDDDCWRPKDALWPADANYSCYADMPDYQRGEMGECQSADPKATSDVYCQQVCGAYPGAWCDPAKCDCVQNSDAWNLSAPIQPLPEHASRSTGLPCRCRPDGATHGRPEGRSSLAALRLRRPPLRPRLALSAGSSLPPLLGSLGVQS